MSEEQQKSKIGKIIGGVFLTGAGLAALFWYLGLRKATEAAPVSFNEYSASKTEAAETGGIVGVTSFCEQKFGKNNLFYDKCVGENEARMHVMIAQHNYSGCVSAYKKSHNIPLGGWLSAAKGGAQYTFCANAIKNYKADKDPVIAEIVDSGYKIVDRAGRFNPKSNVHPDALTWIVAHTDVKSLDDPHYFDMQKGWLDARLQGFAESHTKFEEKVYEYAGMRYVSLLGGKVWFGKGRWVW